MATEKMAIKRGASLINIEKWKKKNRKKVLYLANTLYSDWLDVLILQINQLGQIH